MLKILQPLQMTRQIKFILIGLLLAANIQAAEITLLRPTFFQRVVSAIQECTWHISCYFETRVGATITTILATDKISDSRTTINDNFTNLNNNKIEMSTTSVDSITTLSGLVSVGTITTGTWTGTTLTVSNGGTSSTTLSANQVLLGDGTNELAVVSGLGTSGQFLTSQGAGANPQWTTSSVNEAGNFTWTGEHSFVEATTTDAHFSNSISATTTRFGGTSFTWPGAPIASSSALFTDATGLLSFLQVESVLASTTSAAGAATLNISNLKNSDIYTVYLRNINLSGADDLHIQFNGDSGTNYMWSWVKFGNFATTTDSSSGALEDAAEITFAAKASEWNWKITIYNDTSEAKRGHWQSVWDGSGNNPPDIITGSFSWRNTTARINRITVFTLGAETFNAGANMSIRGIAK